MIRVNDPMDKGVTLHALMQQWHPGQFLYAMSEYGWAHWNGKYWHLLDQPSSPALTNIQHDTARLLDKFLGKEIGRVVPPRKWTVESMMEKRHAGEMVAAFVHGWYVYNKLGGWVRMAETQPGPNTSELNNNAILFASVEEFAAYVTYLASLVSESCTTGKPDVSGTGRDNESTYTPAGTTLTHHIPPTYPRGTMAAAVDP